MLHGSEGCSCRSCSFPSPNGAIWHESPALKSVESTDTLGCLRCVVSRLGKEGGWAPPEGSMQNRNTWAAHPVSPCQLGCGNDLQEAKPTSHRSRPRGQRKGRRDASHTCMLPFLLLGKDGCLLADCRWPWLGL